MHGYGLPRNDDVARPDCADINQYGLKSSASRCAGHNGERHNSFRNVEIKAQRRRTFKRAARNEAKAACQEGLDLRSCPCCGEETSIQEMTIWGTCEGCSHVWDDGIDWDTEYRLDFKDEDEEIEPEYDPYDDRLYEEEQDYAYEQDWV